MPSLGTPATIGGERSPPRSSKTPQMRMSESASLIERVQQRFAFPAAADDDDAADQPAVARPAAHQRGQREAADQQRGEAGGEPARRP